MADFFKWYETDDGEKLKSSWPVEVDNSLLHVLRLGCLLGDKTGHFYHQQAAMFKAAKWTWQSPSGASSYPDMATGPAIPHLQLLVFSLQAPYLGLNW